MYKYFTIVSLLFFIRSKLYTIYMHVLYNIFKYTFRAWRTFRIPNKTMEFRIYFKAYHKKNVYYSMVDIIEYIKYIYIHYESKCEKNVTSHHDHYRIFIVTEDDFVSTKRVFYTRISQNIFRASHIRFYTQMKIRLRNIAWYFTQDVYTSLHNIYVAYVLIYLILIRRYYCVRNTHVGSKYL